MHEVGLMTHAIEMAEQVARENGAHSIHRLVLRVGPHSGVDAEALRFAFDAAAPGTLAAGAQLEIEVTTIHCWCPTCQVQFEPVSVIYTCPCCHDVVPAPESGRELELARLEVS